MIDTKPFAARSIFQASVLLAFAVAAAAAGLTPARFFGRPKPAPPEVSAIVFLAPLALKAPVLEVATESLAAPKSMTLEPQQPAPAPVVARGTLARRPAALSQARRRPSATRSRSFLRLPLSVRLMSGGAPDYPDQYEDGRSGFVTITCKLHPDGTPNGCLTLRQAGGPIFNVAVRSWLNLRDVRFGTTKRSRRPIDKVTFTVAFIGIPPT